MTLHSQSDLQHDARYVYQAYGLRILSDVALPEMGSGDAATAEALPELRIRRRPVAAPTDRRPGTDFRFGADGTGLWWDTVGGFWVSPTGDIDTDPADGVDDDLLAFPLLGPVLALALHARGTFLLHASAVALKSGPGVVLMGDKGAGKSTTATALLEAGPKLIADDIVAFADGALPRLIPAFPQVKLSTEALERLNFGDATVRPDVHEAIDKHRVMIPERFAAAPAPLSRLYVLQRSTDARAPRAETVAPQEALPLILRFAYVPRFGREALQGESGARYFKQAVALAETGSLRRLIVPAGLDRLESLTDFISEDAAATT